MIKKYSKEAVVKSTDGQAMRVAEAAILLDVALFYVSIGLIKVKRSFDGCESGMVRLTAEGTYFDREGTVNQKTGDKKVRSKKLQEPVSRSPRK